ncbi:hypothetical protein FE374_01450 [Georgenia yuyongxinii]|uniref:Uncharacterized protein n=1 Tax=Georgenia yuyongxinii TaxID=2589797 RepID=A0A5B8C2M8_9MICO|nr:hypothetical protein [Georgenia yuyongxinii]QDC23472.1 hypothetical protein FE374_01450 [Georgenia yuyongxinii]
MTEETLEENTRLAEEITDAQRAVQAAEEEADGARTVAAQLQENLAAERQHLVETEGQRDAAMAKAERAETAAADTRSEMDGAS